MATGGKGGWGGVADRRPLEDTRPHLARVAPAARFRTAQVSMPKGHPRGNRRFTTDQRDTWVGSHMCAAEECGASPAFQEKCGAPPARARRALPLSLETLGDGVEAPFALPPPPRGTGCGSRCS